MAVTDRARAAVLSSKACHACRNSKQPHWVAQPDVAKHSACGWAPASASIGCMVATVRDHAGEAVVVSRAPTTAREMTNEQQMSD
jgi:hypothetical protein